MPWLEIAYSSLSTRSGALDLTIHHIQNIFLREEGIEMKKRILSFLMAVGMILCSTSISVFGVDDTSNSYVSISPLWDNVNTITLSISQNGSNILCTGAVQGMTGTTNIDVTLTLYKLVNGSYSYVTSWDASVDGRILASEKTVTGTNGTYKLTLSGTATRSGYAEEISCEFVKSV